MEHPDPEIGLSAAVLSAIHKHVASTLRSLHQASAVLAHRAGRTVEARLQCAELTRRISRSQLALLTALTAFTNRAGTRTVTEVLLKKQTNKTKKKNKDQTKNPLII